MEVNYFYQRLATTFKNSECFGHDLLLARDAGEREPHRIWMPMAEGSQELNAAFHISSLKLVLGFSFA